MTLPLVVTFTPETYPYQEATGPEYRDENGYPITPKCNGYWTYDGSIIANPLAAQPPVIVL